MGSLDAIHNALGVIKSSYVSVKDSMTWISLITYGLSLGVTYITYKWLIRPFLSPLRRVPGLPFNPICGNLPRILSGQSMDSSLKIIEEYGKIVRYYFFFGSERLLIADCEMLKHILVTNSRNYIKPPTRMELMKKVLGNGILLQEGATHAAHKRLMSPAFNQTNIRKMVKHFVHYAKELSAIWEETIDNRPRKEDWGVLQVHADLTRLTLDIIGKTAFGHEFNCLHEPDLEVTSAFNRLLSGSELSWRMAIPFYYSINLIPQVRRFNSDVDIMKSTIRKIIHLKRLKQAQSTGENKEDEVVLDAIMNARDETGAGLSDSELEDEVMTLMVAGHETTSVAMAWTLFVLAQNQEVQTRVRDEINSLVPPDSDTVQVEHLDKMEYLGCVIKETLRLYPPVTMTLRQPLKDDQLGDYFIPKGTVMLLHQGCMMRLPEYWEDPLTFKPERFLTDEGKNMYTFLPFLIGNRMCLGYKFALMEMRAVLSSLLLKFHFDVIPNAVYKRKQLITMRPEPSLRLRVSLIKKPENPTT